DARAQQRVFSSADCADGEVDRAPEEAVGSLDLDMVFPLVYLAPKIPPDHHVQVVAAAAASAATNGTATGIRYAGHARPDYLAGSQEISRADWHVELVAFEDPGLKLRCIDRHKFVLIVDVDLGAKV